MSTEHGMGWIRPPRQIKNERAVLDNIGQVRRECDVRTSNVRGPLYLTAHGEMTLMSIENGKPTLPIYIHRKKRSLKILGIEFRLQDKDEFTTMEYQPATTT
jgi:hypothetical protein